MVSARCQREEFVWAREVSPHFLQGGDVYTLCVYVYAQTHTLHVGYLDSAQVGMRNLENLEEIQIYCSNS